MGYTFNCNGCQTRYDHFPPFSGEFTETFLETTPSPLTQMFKPGEKVTLCRDCSEALFTAAQTLTCIRCGWSTPLAERSESVAACPRCDNEDFRVSGEAYDERA